MDEQLLPGLHFFIPERGTVTVTGLPLFLTCCNSPPLSAFGRLRATVNNFRHFLIMLSFSQKLYPFCGNYAPIVLGFPSIYAEIYAS